MHGARWVRRSRKARAGLRELAHGAGIANRSSMSQQLRQPRECVLQYHEPPSPVVDDLLGQAVAFQLRAVRGYAVEHYFNDFVAGNPGRRELPAVVQLDDGAAAE